MINLAVCLCTYLTNGMTLKKWLASIPMAFLVVWSFLDVGRASTGYHLYSCRPNQQLNQQASYTPEDQQLNQQASYIPEDQTNS